MHIPVLPDEVLKQVAELNPKKLIDGTVGGGGYLKAILKQNPETKVLGIDLDQTSLGKLDTQLAQDGLAQKAKLVHGNFARIKEIVDQHSFNPVSMVILDLGFSSLQLDDPTRGLSFQSEGPLDMRYDQDRSLTAKAVVNEYSEFELTRIFKEYGEEKFAKRIAHKILKARTKSIETTRQLREVIGNKSLDTVRRIFQAIRIEVNQELSNLINALPDIVDILEKGGRIIIVSFHSLEDRIVKEFFKQQADPCICPPEFPKCVCEKKPKLKIITKKPVIASPQEIARNPRSKPAKMRIAEKII
jgi:16S rRNA (cytosine1402-N4)-methyltransferase